MELIEGLRDKEKWPCFVVMAAAAVLSLAYVLFSAFTNSTPVSVGDCILTFFMLLLPGFITAWVSTFLVIVWRHVFLFMFKGPVRWMLSLFWGDIFDDDMTVWERITYSDGSVEIRPAYLGLGIIWFFLRVILTLLGLLVLGGIAILPFAAFPVILAALGFFGLVSLANLAPDETMKIIILIAEYLVVAGLDYLIVHFTLIRAIKADKEMRASEETETPEQEAPLEPNASICAVC